jgi:hypothetical protein
VEFAGGESPEGWKLHIWAVPIDMTTRNEGIPSFYNYNIRFAEANEKGRFVIEGLVPGEYEFRLAAMAGLGRAASRGVEVMKEINQRVNVKGGVETTVKLTIDLSRK